MMRLMLCIWIGLLWVQGAVLVSHLFQTDYPRRPLLRHRGDDVVALICVLVAFVASVVALWEET